MSKTIEERGLARLAEIKEALSHLSAECGDEADDLHDEADGILLDLVPSDARLLMMSIMEEHSRIMSAQISWLVQKGSR